MLGNWSRLSLPWHYFSNSSRWNISRVFFISNFRKKLRMNSSAFRRYDLSSSVVAISLAAIKTAPHSQKAGFCSLVFFLSRSIYRNPRSIPSRPWCRSRLQYLQSEVIHWSRSAPHLLIIAGPYTRTGCCRAGSSRSARSQIILQLYWLRFMAKWGP